MPFQILLENESTEKKQKVDQINMLKNEILANLKKDELKFNT